MDPKQAKPGKLYQKTFRGASTAKLAEMADEWCVRNEFVPLHLKGSIGIDPRSQIRMQAITIVVKKDC